MKDLETGLPIKQLNFCRECAIDGNASRAYKAAGYTYKNDLVARASAAKLLSSSNIQAQIARERAKLAESVEITPARWLLEVKAAALADIADYGEIVTKNGKQTIVYKDTKDIPRDKRGAIEGFKMGRNGIELKIMDRSKALDMLGKYMGLLNDKMEVSGNIEHTITEADRAMMARFNAAAVIEGECSVE